MKVNITIEVPDYLLNKITKDVLWNDFSDEKEVRSFIIGIILDDYEEFYFVKEEIFEEVLRRAKEKGFRLYKR